MTLVSVSLSVMENIFKRVKVGLTACLKLSRGSLQDREKNLHLSLQCGGRWSNQHLVSIQRQEGKLQSLRRYELQFR